MASKHLPELGPDDAPYLTDEQVKELKPAKEFFADLGIPVPKPLGRPKAAKVKQSVTIRMDEDIVAYFKAGGPGWQTRMHDVLAREARKKKS